MLTRYCNHHHPQPETRRNVCRWALKASLVGLTAGASLLLSAKAKAGWGRCGVSGCPCQQFTPTAGNNAMCYNCGHNYSSHW